MNVTIEYCEGDVYVARSGKEHSVYGDPYELACTVVVNDGVATIKGMVADQNLTRDTVRKLSGLLKERGVHTLRIERVVDGIVTTQDWKIH